MSRPSGVFRDGAVPRRRVEYEPAYDGGEERWDDELVSDLFSVEGMI